MPIDTKTDSPTVDSLSVTGRPVAPSNADAHIFKDGSQVVYYDVTGRSGSTGVVSKHTNVDGAVNAFFVDYDGNIDGTFGAQAYVRPGSYKPAGTMDYTRGCGLIGAQRGYRRSPRAREYLTLFETDNMPANTPMFRMETAEVPNDTAGNILYGVHCRGSGRNSDTTTFVRMGEKGRGVVENCFFRDTGGNGIYANDAFSAQVISTQFRDCGLYSEDGSGNETGTNAILSEIDDGNVNLKMGGVFVIQGPGAGVSDPADDIPSGIRATSGASVGVGGRGGERSGGKIYSSVGDAASATTGKVAWLKGEDLRVEDCSITGEFQASNRGIIMESGTLQLRGVHIEKVGVPLEIEAMDTSAGDPITDCEFEDTSDDGNGLSTPEGCAIHVPDTSAHLTMNGCSFRNIDTSPFYIEGIAPINADTCRFGAINQAAVGAPVIQDEKGGTIDTTYRLEKASFENDPPAICNKLQRVQHVTGSIGGAPINNYITARDTTVDDAESITFSTELRNAPELVDVIPHGSTDAWAAPASWSTTGFTVQTEGGATGVPVSWAAYGPTYESQKL